MMTGICTNCGAAVYDSDTSCRKCGASFTARPSRAATYLDRKAVFQTCARRGCGTPAGEFVLCDKHAEEHRNSNRRSAQRKRKARRVQMRLGW
jgi:uncharacterized membrane protein YvbJ